MKQKLMIEHLLKFLNIFECIHAAVNTFYLSNGILHIEESSKSPLMTDISKIMNL